MKKLLLASMLSALCVAPAFAGPSDGGYLTDGSNRVVKSGSGLCFNTKADFVPDTECGDVIEHPKKIELPVKPKLLPGLVEAVKHEVKQQKIVISPEVLFGFDSIKLTKAGQEVLLKEVVSVNPIKVEVAGHTDAIGSGRYNQKLSQKRANAVQEYLVANGIAADKIIANGFGETNLICEEKNPTKTSKCSAQNRRVEVTTEYVK